MAIPPVPAPLADHYRRQHRQDEGADTVLAQFVLFDGFDSLDVIAPFEAGKLPDGAAAITI